ncbi:MAG: hypothetical protein ACYC9J_03980 [Sulfuricaulis sp.]
MKRTLIYSAIIATVLPILLPAVLAADQGQLPTPDQDQTRNADRLPPRERGMHRQIYGAQMMTQHERNEYRARMRSAKTAEEREQIRKENHERMKERAKERGVTLPDVPPMRGSGMEPGNGMGPGMGGGPRQ